MPIQTKESYRWLENLRRSIALLSPPESCVHIGDRESDIYELFFLAQDLGTRFLVRIQTNRLAEPPSKAPPTNAAVPIPRSSRAPYRFDGAQGSEMTARNIPSILRAAF
ncbi:hypothetical protein QCM80_38665 [Bradyrhizobium sp. SSUT112]|uniref:hypothetical protein n=1 Tax=Bradyrhizobium sp. SSUT112 TaxID=3040604 RepID=UPI00244BD8BD|nr:hypothetical protein [Bradyrhizobium sp. SSUT112]MDH2356516.1 hypothetical protein [Bradyrhizobium sp. SSUT112]